MLQGIKRINPVVVILWVATLLRGWNLGAAQLWYDESFTLLVARLDLPGLLRATAGDVHPPLWYLIEWITVRILGESPAALRLPAALASMAGLYLTWRLAQALQLSRVGTLAALGLLTINTTQIWYAQESRMYALLQALTVLQLLSLVRRRWLQLGAATLAAVYLHNYGLIYSAAVGLLGLYLERKNIRPLLLSMGLPLLAFLPWGAALYLQMSQVAAGYWIQPFRAGTVIYCLSAIFWGFVMDDPLSAIAPLVFMGALFFSVLRSVQGRRNGLLLWLGLAPLALVCIVSLWRPVLLYRGLIGSVPVLALLFGEELAGRQTTLNRWIAAALVAPVLLAGSITLSYKYDDKGGDSKILSQYILPEWRAGDVMLHVNDGSYIIFAAHSNLPMLELESGCPPPEGALSPITRAALGIQRVTLEDALSQYNRVWLVGGIGSTSFKCEEDYLSQLAAAADRTIFEDNTRFTHVGVWIYESQRAIKTRGNKSN